ncbi:MAG TPA: 2-hydroxyacyl-CoA dehydratase family protein, partial [Deltaproteobacteria bacterium]|nr:2-hydroxyacyl-CoA dehydratase family protein [Deltaproteobacteria bacterium]
LSHKLCPRMFGYYKDRLSYILDTAKKAGVDGVILQNIRFCDLHGSENGIFERDLEAQGISCMRMEREYGPLVETGRIRMRIDAFMERIG